MSWEYKRGQSKFFVWLVFDVTRPSSLLHIFLSSSDGGGPAQRNLTTFLCHSGPLCLECRESPQTIIPPHPSPWVRSSLGQDDKRFVRGLKRRVKDLEEGPEVSVYVRTTWHHSNMPSSRGRVTFSRKTTSNFVLSDRSTIESLSLVTHGPS